VVKDYVKVEGAFIRNINVKTLRAKFAPIATAQDRTIKSLQFIKDCQDKFNSITHQMELNSHKKQSYPPVKLDKDLLDLFISPNWHVHAQQIVSIFK